MCLLRREAIARLGQYFTIQFYPITYETSIYTGRIMSFFKNKRPGRGLLGLILVVAVLALSIFGGLSAASAEDQPAVDTVTATATPVPADDSSFAVPATPKGEKALDTAPTKVETPKSDSADTKAVTPDPQPESKPQPKETENISDSAESGTKTMSWKLPEGITPNDGWASQFPQTTGTPAAESCKGAWYQVDTYKYSSAEEKAAVDALDDDGLLTLNELGQAEDAGVYISHTYVEEKANADLCEPTKIDIPAQPAFEDTCGLNNASWSVPADTDTLNWEENDGGHLIVTIVKDGVVFTDGTTTHDFGTAPDSGEACPEASATWTCDSVTVHNDYTDAANVVIAKLDQDGKVVPGTLIDYDPPLAGGADLTRSGLTKGTWDVLVTWDSSEDTVFEEMYEVTGCDTPPPATDTCPPGDKWTDKDGDGKIDDGECTTPPTTHKPTPPKKLTTAPHAGMGGSTDGGNTTILLEGAAGLVLLLAMGRLVFPGKRRVKGGAHL
ncbi:MAG: hypothetical protein ABJA64_03185 [Candidatus Saccharibacteria bacterium]